MFALDLFNNDHERRLNEGAVDNLEQRRIDDLAMKMDDLVARAKTATTPEVKAALIKEFQKCKAERDGYYKVAGHSGLGEETHEFKGAHGKLDVERTPGRTVVKRKEYPGSEEMKADQFPNSRLRGKGSATQGSTGSSALNTVTGGSYRKMPRLDHDANDAPNYDVDEAGIPGNVPTEKIPGKEDLLKGRGRSYYESVKEGNPSKKVFKDKAGKPVGEIGIDPESSPGNGEWYVHHYATGYSVVGFDSAAEAKRELLYVHKHPDAVEGHPSTTEQGVTEGSEHNVGDTVNYSTKVPGFSKSAQGGQGKITKKTATHYTVNGKEMPHSHIKSRAQGVAEGGYDIMVKHPQHGSEWEHATKVNGKTKHTYSSKEKANNVGRNLMKGSTSQYAVAKSVKDEGVAEAGIPGSVPADKIPGKEDLLKGRGRSYYEADQKKNSEQVAEAEQHLAIASKYTGDGQFQITVNNKHKYIVTVAGFEIDPLDTGILDSFYLTNAQTGKTKHVASTNSPLEDAIYEHLWYNQRPALKQIYAEDMAFYDERGWNNGRPDRLEGLPLTGWNATPATDFIGGYKAMKRATGQQDVDEGKMGEIDAMRQDLERMNDRQFYTAYGISKAAFQQKYRALLKPALDEKKLGQNRPKLGSARDMGKSVKKFRAQRGLDETGSSVDKPSDPAQDRLLTKARREYPKARTDAEALAMKILGKEQDDVDRLDRVNDREDRMIAKLADVEKNLQSQIDNLSGTQELDESQQLHQGDPIVVTAPNEFEGKTGEIYDFSPSGTFVIVDLYNHGKHSMHLSDIEYNQYADNQEEEDDWYDTQEDTMEGFQNFNKVEPYAVCLAGKPVKKFDYYEEARRFHDNWKQKLYREGNKEKADKITLLPLNLDEEQKPYDPNEFRPVGPITIVPPRKLKSGETHQGINDYWKAQGQAPIYKTNEAGSPAQQAAIAIAMKRAGKKPESVDESNFDQYQKQRNTPIKTSAEYIKQQSKAKPGDPVAPPFGTKIQDLKKKGVDEGTDDIEDVSGLTDAEYNRIAGYVRKKYPGTQLSGVGRNSDGSFNVMIDSGSGRHQFKLRFRDPEETALDEGARGDAIKQGYQAAVKGLTKQQNPYYKSVNGQTPPEAYDWEAGWEDARDSGKIPQGVAEGTDDDVEHLANTFADLYWSGKIGMTSATEKVKMAHKIIQAVEDGRLSVEELKQDIRDLDNKGVAENTGRSLDNAHQRAVIKINKMLKDPSISPVRRAELEQWKKEQMASMKMARGASIIPKNKLPLPEQGVAEGFSLKKTNVNKYMGPGDPDEQDINIKDTDYEIINNKTGQVVGTASWTTNDYFGPGALQITMKNGATRYLDIWEREKRNPQSAFNRFVKDPKTANKYKEQGVAEAQTDFQKRRQRERDVDAGKPVTKQRQSRMTDYAKKRAQDRKDMELGEDSSTSSDAAERAILNRIMVAHTDLLMKFGPEKIMQAAEEVAYNVGDVDEIGTSDVSAWVHEVKRILGA